MLEGCRQDGMFVFCKPSEDGFTFKTNHAKEDEGDLREGA
jgi:hypothetical protein